MNINCIWAADLHTCLSWDEGHLSQLRGLQELDWNWISLLGSQQQQQAPPSVNLPGLPGSKWGRAHVTQNALILEIRAGDSRFEVKVEANASAISLAKLREIAFSEIFIKALLVFILFLDWEGRVVCQTDFTKLDFFFLMLLSAWLMVSLSSYSKMCARESVSGSTRDFGGWNTGVCVYLWLIPGHNASPTGFVYQDARWQLCGEGRVISL